MVLQSQKKLQVLEKKFFWKKNFFQLICADMVFKTVCGNFVSAILRFQKIVFHCKTINKTRSTKNQENFAHRFGDSYLTNHLVKFLQDTIKP